MIKKITRLIWLTVILVLFSSTISTDIPKQIPKFTLVEVSPSALGVMIHSFDQVLIYFHNQTNPSDLQNRLKEYNNKLAEIKQLYSSDHTLFAYLNRTADFMGKLSNFGQQNGFRLINTFYDLHFNGSQDLVDFYSENIHPKLPLLYKSDLKKLKETRYRLLFEYSNFEDLDVFNKLYQKMNHFLNDFHTSCFAIANSGQNKSTISLYDYQKKVATYSLFNRTIKEAADELVQAVNIDTLPTVIQLNDESFHRVFGGSITDQLILVYKNKSDIESILQYYKKAAQSNRYESLAYERVLFTTVDSHFFSENFNEDVEELLKDTAYVIYFTKTDYDKFQLKKYRFLSSSEWTEQQLLRFIEDVRLKRLDPEYKSEPIPTEQEQNSTILRKIVGKTFIPEVYQKPDQSIIILFVDSKAEESYSNIKSLLQEFTVKYKKAIEGKLVTAIFDLDKNEHKLLYLKEAPQLIVFDKSNKKQTKYIKIGSQLSLDGLRKQIEKAVSNINLADTNEL